MFSSREVTRKQKVWQPSLRLSRNVREKGKGKIGSKNSRMLNL